jgi:hypothetical protein
MPKQYQDAVEEAYEFGQRFPDLPDYEVWEHVAFVCQIPMRLLGEGTWIGRCILVAYNGHIGHALGMLD